VVQSTGDQGCFPSHARAIHDQLGSADKQLVWVPGDHYLLSPPGQREEVADLIAAWLDR
jgi:esterase/lipase